MGIDLPEVDQTASFTLLTAFRLSFIPDLYAGKFLISREWGLPFPRLYFLFPSRPGLPSTVYYNYSIFQRERYHVKPVIDTPRATPLIPNLPPMIRVNTRFAPTSASGFNPILGANLVFARLRHSISSQPDRDILESPGGVTNNRAPMDAIAPMTLLMRRIKDNGGNGIDRVNRPGVESVVNAAIPAVMGHQQMLFIFNRTGPPPGANVNDGKRSMASTPFVLVRPDSSNSPGRNVINRDNITREHVGFAEIENNRVHVKENGIENVKFYHMNNSHSRAGGGPEPGVPSPARGPEPPRLGRHPASLTVQPDATQPVQPGHLTPGTRETEEIMKPGKAEKIKIEQTDLDLEQFTHRVYAMLERKIKIEKEMRGL